MRRKLVLLIGFIAIFYSFESFCHSEKAASSNLLKPDNQELRRKITKLRKKLRLFQLSHAYKEHFTKNQIIATEKNARPQTKIYLKKRYLNKHIRKFNRKGGSFLVVKSWLESSPYESFPPKKYCMLKPDMRGVINSYRKSNDISIIEEALGYKPNELKGFDDELYIFDIDKTRFVFEIPSGTETGANNLWEPGGLTSGGYKEAVLIDKQNADSLIVHKKGISYLQSQFKWQKVKK